MFEKELGGVPSIPGGKNRGSNEIHVTRSDPIPIDDDVAWMYGVYGEKAKIIANTWEYDWRGNHICDY